MFGTKLHYYYGRVGLAKHPRARVQNKAHRAQTLATFRQFTAASTRYFSTGSRGGYSAEVLRQLRDCSVQERWRGPKTVVQAPSMDNLVVKTIFYG